MKEYIGMPLPIYLKEQYLTLLQKFTRAHAELKSIQEERQLQRVLKDRKFTCFNLLPIELRLKIWEFGFDSHIQPRVHCVNIVNSSANRDATFISNQPVHPSLHTNHESRSTAFSRPSCRSLSKRISISIRISSTSLTSKIVTYSSASSWISKIPERYKTWHFERISSAISRFQGISPADTLR